MTAATSLSTKEVAALLSMHADVERCKDKWAECRVAATLRQRDAEIARLHEALRDCAIGTSIESDLVSMCFICKGEWWAGDAEDHVPGCLAAPREGA